MNVLNKYTIESLKLNKGRTWVTIIGIALSMSLLTAVITAVYSGQTWLADNEIARSGGWHGYYYDMDSETAAKAEHTKAIDEASYLEEEGWGYINSINIYKPYLLVEGMDDKFTDMYQLKLISGRLPENETEILLPDHLLGNGGVEYKEGDTVTVDLGQRMADGRNLSVYEEFRDAEAGGEEIVNTTKKTYTVVGFYERLDALIEPTCCPGYTALTKRSVEGASLDSNLRYSAMFTVKKPGKIHDFFASADNLTENYTYHRDLVIYYGASTNSSIMFFLYSFTAILVLIIVCGSVALIYNSFAISLSERMKQFGILKSIGASRKQIRNTVYFEALALDAVAIPLGVVVGWIGIGTTLYLLRDSFAMVLGSMIGQVEEAVPISLKINLKLMLLSALICVAMTLISAWIPGHKAVRLNAIDCIRQSTNVRCKAKQVKTSRLVQKLFGFEGTLAVKNFKRDRKKYRTTVLSLAASIVLFVTSSTFCNYLNTSVSSVNGRNNDTDLRLCYYGDLSDNSVSVSQMLEQIDALDAVEDCVDTFMVQTNLEIKAKDLSSEFLAMPEDYAGGDYNAQNDSYQFYAHFLFIDDAAFEALLDQYHLSKEEYMNAKAPKAVALGNLTDIYSSSDGSVNKYINFNLLNQSGKDITITYNVYDNAPEGYVYNGDVYDEQGQQFLRFVKKEYKDNWAEASEEDCLEIPESDLSEERQCTIGFVAEENPYYRPFKYTMQLVYPSSLKDQITTKLSQEHMGFQGWIAIKAPDYMAAESQMTALIQNQGWDAYVDNQAKTNETSKRLVWIITVFSLGFIVLISLIAMANVFNTISTNFRLRKREFAMLKSTGMTGKAFRRMMNFECLYYGFRSILFGFPVSILLTYGIYRWISNEMYTSFYIPWYSIVIAMGSVFLVVFMTMLYAMKKIDKENLIDNLKTDTI